MSCIVFIFLEKTAQEKEKQTKENQFVQSFMSETGGHRKNIACSMFTILLGDSIPTNKIKIEFS